MFTDEKNQEAGDSSNPLAPAVDRIGTRLAASRITMITGRVTEVVGTLVKALVPNASVGEVCELRDPRGRLLGEGEVVGFEDNAAILSVYGELLGLSSQTLVVPTGRSQEVPVSDALLGRVARWNGQTPRRQAAYRLGDSETLSALSVSS